MHRRVAGIAAALLVATWAGEARADLVNFDLAGKLYSKYLYRNNDSQGLLNYGNPFWSDNISGDNGIGTEFELKVFGRVSKYVQAYARIQSRFGELWQDWWENGDASAGRVANTSGESEGMNHASYIKLRGTYVRATLPSPFKTVDWGHVITWGSSDLGMFNPWSIGKVRYIDRDNGKGIFLDGHLNKVLSYTLAAIALPKLWVGPWWSTGIGDPLLVENGVNPFWSQDWAYATKFVVSPSWGTFTLIGTLTNDLEVDRTDPDAKGSLYPTCTDDLGNPIAGCTKDHATDWYSRYWNNVWTLEAQVDPLDWLSLNGFIAVSVGEVDERLSANGVALNQGVSPLAFKSTAKGWNDGAKDWAFKLRTDFSDPFGLGLSFKLEYFNIGEDFNSIFGARREADVLLTDGFIEGGQLPTLNLANEFVDFDEPWVESCIGWHGVTLVPQFTHPFSGGTFEISGEGTFLTYNQNNRRAKDDQTFYKGTRVPKGYEIPRDVDEVYPTFLHSEGYTDTDLYDYANTQDRGRDPRSVYRRYQDRLSAIAVLNAKVNFDVWHGIELGFKAKYIFDRDLRSDFTTQDDYRGDILTTRVRLAVGLADGLTGEVGLQFDEWWEKGRKGTLTVKPDGSDLSATGYHDVRTQKIRPWFGVMYQYEGLKLRYQFEFLDKDQWRAPSEPDQKWLVFRSKASLEVSW